MALKPAPANAKLYDIPPRTLPTECRGKDCMQDVFFVPNPTTGRSVPVSCDVEGTFRPLGVNPGRGISHFQTCPNAKDFSHRGKRG